MVCSGVKSILDIPRTLELLETQGVFVGAYQSEDREFPAFYTRKSGVKAPYGIENASEAAHILKTSVDLEMNSGLLIGVPIPKEFAMDGNSYECPRISNVIKRLLFQRLKSIMRSKKR